MSLPTVAIIGSGFSGMIAAIQLKKQLNITAQVFESTNDIGGTWSYNVYPGCGSDVPSHVYSFSFDLNPNWSKRYSGQKEIHQYMRDVAKRHGVYEQTQFETEVVSASWIEEDKKWKLELKTVGNTTNQIKYFDFLFSGVGALRIPYIPKEFQSFEGKIIHSAYWDSEYDLKNKKIAIIGSGASSVQIIPAIVKDVAHIYSYQRTPTWIKPRNQIVFPTILKKLFRYIPFLMYFYRLYEFFSRELRFGVLGNRHTFLAKFFKWWLVRGMTKALVSRGRSDLVSKLIPKNVPGCKRVGTSDDYLQALCEDNVTVNISPIVGVKGRSIITEDGTESEVDVLCLATGYNTNNILGNLQVYGRDGVSLNKLWDENTSKTYKTVNIYGFPNFCMMLGPGSGLGHNSVITNIECQVDYMISLMKYMIKNQIKSMEPKEKAQEKFSNELQAGFKNTVWTSGCNSWYLDKNGGIQFLWPKTVTSFYFMLKRTNFEADYIIKN